MDRDLGKPKKSQASTGLDAGLMCAPAGLTMKQIFMAHSVKPLSRARVHLPTLRQTAPAVRHPTRIAASSRAHDKDGTFNKEIYR